MELQNKQPKMQQLPKTQQIKTSKQLQKNQQDEYYVLELTEGPTECRASGKQGLLAIIFAVFLVIAVPCMITGYAKVYSQVLDYKDLGVSSCYGGPVITGYQITPQIYNTSLTYYPATLQFETREVGTNQSVLMTYPTYFERTFAESCVFHNDKYGRNPCDKLVGDVITKYNELVSVAEFPCYIADDLIVGLAGEHTVIGKYYRLTTVGIIFLVFDMSIITYAIGHDYLKLRFVRAV